MLVIVGLWVRLQVEESPIFRQATERADARAAAGVIDKMPVLLVLRTYPREILTAMGARMAERDRQVGARLAAGE